MSTSIEHIHQRAIVQWAQCQRVDIKSSQFYLSFAKEHETLFDYMHATPNGGTRSKKTKMVKGRKVTYSPEGKRLKAEGVKAGVHDMQLTVPLYGFAGLWIEVKAPSTPESKAGTVSQEQVDFGDRMQRAGYAVAYCWGHNQIEDAITSYFKGDKISLKRLAVPKYKR